MALYINAYVYLRSYLAEIFSEWETFQTKVAEKTKHILRSVTFFENRAVYWDNLEKMGRARQAADDNITRSMRFACWTAKATDTQSEHVTLIACPLQKWSRERASTLRL